ncbi:Uncharacterised protein [Leclercia adecarboxylata]|uniref:Uncharacterized protein n=1 Tax=Leclercia adecarboxylata TaxID=83655 RepID=A0A4U9IGK7_9ENTR|nr:Uncharacterised protein [Leclercia adecarboxylata]
MFERRAMIVSMTLLAAGGMLITASSQSLAMMIFGTALTGLFSVVGADPGCRSRPPSPHRKNAAKWSAPL